MNTQADYDSQQCEQQAQAYWDQHQSFVVTEDTDKPKYYALCMFPYPSGKLHMGHVRNYTIGDVVSRYKRMQGFNVLQPMGWDAFGLPAENAAINHQVPPAEWTYQNIAYMKKQLQRLGFGYDWSRELATCTPQYYRWEQWFFTQLVERGLAYKKMAVVNWDPVEQTVLANEQVDADGRGWRSGALVERREIPQWFIKITDYAEELLKDLDTLEGWPEAVKTMQRNWIGRSQGVAFDWQLAGREERIRVYTTRPDTVMGVTFMAISAEHPLAIEAATNQPELAAFIDECKRTGTSEAAVEKLEKRGMPTGFEVIHPVSDQPVPVWVGNYVLMSYGGGAVMGVPAHDVRDYAFAKQYDLPIVQVVDSAEGGVSVAEEAFVAKEGIVAINSGRFDGLGFKDCFEAVADYLVAHANGERQTNYRLRDWGVSRQRYWGCPIPVVYDQKGEVHTVPAEQLPVILPEDVAFSGVKSPIKENPEWAKTTVPSTGEPGTRETDTFDTFFESSWYYARFCCPDAESMLDERANYWLPVNQYIGGVEHAVLHLLYARLFHKLMRDLGLVSSDEPFSNLLTQGMVVAETFFRDEEGQKRQWFSPNDVDMQFDAKGRLVGATLKADGLPVSVGQIEKMSKSKNNGVDPQAMIERFGADTVRLFSMFASPPDQSLEWKQEGVEGMHRFLRRVWRLVSAHADGAVAAIEYDALDKAQQALRYKTHATIEKVSDDVGRRFTFNTAIAAIMELVNEAHKFVAECEKSKALSGQNQAVLTEALRAIVLLLAPITPHICHALWLKLGGEGTVSEQPWPVVDRQALVKQSLTLAVQVNGKVRASIEVAADADRASIEAAALSEENVQRFIDGQTVRKVIVVPGRLVNIVAN